MIKVRLIEPSEGGALYPRYVEESSLLAVEASLPSYPWPYGVSIDAMVIMDLDEERVLVNFDLHWAREAWPVLPALKRPSPIQAARLRLSEETAQKRYFDRPVEARTDEDRSYLLIQFGEPSCRAFWVELSEKCLAWIDEDCLIGFFVDLDERTD